MLNVNELRNGAVFKEDDQIYQVLNYEHIKTGRGSGNIKLKVRNLRTGSLTEKSFMTGARVKDADVVKQKAQFLYKDNNEYHFMDPKSFEQFTVPETILVDQAKFLQEGLEITLVVSGGEALAVELPMSLIYTITDTGPGIKGNTVSNVYKDAVLDNGLIVKVPLFMSNGEKVKVDTRTGQYVERVK